MPSNSIADAFDALVCRKDEAGVRSRIETLTLERLSAGEVVLRTRYAGVNFKDCLAVTGRAKIIAEFPRIAGIEAVGEVLSSSDPRFAPGDAVLVHGFQTGIAHDGGFSARMRVPAAHLQKLPMGLSPFDAAAIGVPGFTVAMALERFEADVAVSITGIAGPGGGSEDKPVGYVCFNARLADGTVIARDPTIPGGRADIRERSALVAMHLLRLLLRGEQPSL